MPTSASGPCARERARQCQSRAYRVRRLGPTLAVALVLSSGMVADRPASADSLDKLVIGASAADLVTTEIALSRPGTAEANPLGPSTAARVALKVAGTAAVLVVSRKVNHKTARLLKIAALVVWSGAAVHNLTVQR